MRGRGRDRSRTKVADGTMPPWHADPAHGSFANERRLTAAQKTTIARWVSGGAPEGKAADLPAAPVYSDGWNIGKPDVVLSMQEDYPIPATGTVPYQYLEIPANFPEDRWIQAWEIKPGDRAAVHHIIVSTRAPAAPPAAPRAAAGATARGRWRAASAAALQLRRRHGNSRRSDRW